MAESTQIDPQRLDDEWLRQAQLTRKAGRAEAEARHAYNQTKARLDVLAARLNLRIRDNPGKYGLPAKPNNDVIAAAVTVNEEHVQLQQELNLRKFELDLASTEVLTMLDRRKALERLVELLALDYYSEKTPRAQSAAGRETSEKNLKRAMRTTQNDD